MHKYIPLLKSFYSGLIGMDAESISQKTWESALLDRMHETSVPDPATYWEKLQKSKQEQAEYLEYLVVPETWLFRHKESFDYLKKLVHERWISQNRRSEPLRLLSVPCSTGEEPYSLAITLLEAGVPPGWFSIDAVDISQKFITEAAQGIIAARSFRNCSEHYKRTYFTPHPDGRFQVQHFVRRQVRFMQGNIVSGSFLIERCAYDIIFCRNLFIYLTAVAQAKVQQNLERILADEGILFVSPVESQIVRNWGYHAEGPVEACAYLKNKKPVVKPLAPHITVNHVQENLYELLNSVKQEADAGNFDVAAELCDRYLKLESTNSEAQFYMGLIEQARGNEFNAEKAFSKAIYLNPLHTDALLCLSLLLEKKGDQEQAKLLRSRAAKEYR